MPSLAIGRRAEAQVGAQRLGLKFPPHVHAVVETAGGQHDPAPSGDRHLPAAMLHDRAADAVSVAVQAQQAGVRPHRDTGAQHAREQPGRQGLAARRVAPANEQPAHTLGHPPGERRDSLARHPSHQIHPAVIGTGRRDRDGCFQ